MSWDIFNGKIFLKTFRTRPPNLFWVPEKDPFLYSG